MNKFWSRFYEWLLTSSTSQVIVFMICVWLPFLFVFGYPVIAVNYVTHDLVTYWDWVIRLGTIVLVLYLIYIPLIFDSIKNAINNKRRNK